ncbi:AAA family ATPase [Clostridium botulinum]|uniref:AAA family ATPase n=1 Tax=Clostridium botulinum TaxID=1491 RepID=UPI001C9AFFB4|nr:AAA family ATPase [Clostridium botulinum]MBY6838674.1 AAA family ATPase [Clostridium botulinum]
MAFRKKGAKKIGGKFLCYGYTGSGKSYFGLTFPKIGAIDSETGLGFYEDRDIEIGGKLYNGLEFVDTTSDLDELEEDLDEIIEGNVDINTLSIDSETKFYNTMDIACTEVVERKAKETGKAVDTRGKWGMVKNINMKLQQAKISASARGIHVVSTAQGVDITDDKNKVIGRKPDAHKSLRFDYDVVLWFFNKEDKKTGDLKYYAQVEKDRTNVTKVGQIIENCTYDVWKDYFEGRTNLETSGANFTKDLKESTKSVVTNVEKAENLSQEIMSTIKEKSSDESKKTDIKNVLKESGLDVKALNNESVDKLKDLLLKIQEI